MDIGSLSPSLHTILILSKFCLPLFSLIWCCQKKEATNIQLVNKKLTVAKRLLKEEHDCLQKQVSHLVYENEYMWQQLQNHILLIVCNSAAAIAAILPLNSRTDTIQHQNNTDQHQFNSATRIRTEQNSNSEQDKSEQIWAPMHKTTSPAAAHTGEPTGDAKTKQTKQSI
ncbi:hypothetical protein TEA_010451 [Camellia sinensis var. sinensis]|uniref:Uncharacterized protein n=1 Tax=Camellia sinensis var. sinensis TaxID=542762 RepID=A0A4S4EFV7_CAMSN|nr:hypothetical protein TEA_010451 [Camellia sinensis var. sinensis]